MKFLSGAFLDAFRKHITNKIPRREASIQHAKSPGALLDKLKKL